MSSCRKPGCSSGIPSKIPLKDMTGGGSSRTVKTDATLAGSRPVLKDQQNGKKLNVPNPLK